MSDNKSESKAVTSTKNTELRKYATSIEGEVYVTEAENAIDAGEKALKLSKEKKS